jgi:glycosyltransferase involved in cell wall biosynthesis
VKILVYDDNPDYGGHQIMACHGVESLIEDPSLEITFMLNPANRKLTQRVSGMANLQILEAPCTTRQLQSLNPDLMLCIQGDTNQSINGISTARRAGIKCISYLALPHSLKQMGARLGRLRDLYHRHTLNLPDRYIVLSEGLAESLRARGVTQPITIVPNGIPTPKRTAASNPPTPNSVLGVFGRIEFKQKQQDFMVRTFLNHSEVFKNCHLHIAGTGPDAAKLHTMIAGHENISFQPWMDDVEKFYRSIDVLVIPSRFEGVPLVMLEALARGIPVLGSRCDGMKDLLPQNRTFDPENSESLSQTFSTLQSTWKKAMPQLQKRITEEMSLNVFKQNFHLAICSRDR